MQVVLVVAAVVVGYMLGSFPSGYLISKLWGVDILRHHSGRTGGTNVFRVLGLLPALLTGALDVGKGALAVWAAGQISGLPIAEVLAGAAAILGHNFSFALRFRGREMAYQDLGRAKLMKVCEALADVGAVEGTPRMEGRLMGIVLAPSTKKKTLPKPAPEKEPAEKTPVATIVVPSPVRNG